MSLQSSSQKRVDRWFLILSAILAAGGFFIFASAALGLLSRESASLGRVLLSQGGLGLLGGGVAAYLLSRVHYRFWRKHALVIFISTLVLTILVFVPGLGFEHGGARRWISLGPITLQPAEFLKLGFIIYLAAWLSGIKQKIHKPLYGLLPFAILVGVTGALLLIQPDTDTLVVIFAAGLAMYFAAGARKRDIGGLVLAGLLALVLLAAARPYVMDRILTFVDPTRDPLGSSYQLQQSLIAIGSGQIFGRGLGQSVQKFDYLPEPIGDSIFAVAAEEFGFVGSVILVALFLLLALRGLWIAARAPDLFGSLLVLGLVVMIALQSFMNIAAMLGLVPLTGMPLLFVSHGGTALFITLAEIGIILNVSRYLGSGKTLKTKSS